MYNCKNLFAGNQYWYSNKVSNVANSLIENEGDNSERLNDLVMQMANSANVFKIMSDIFCNTSENK